MLKAPKRGFIQKEYENRLSKMQKFMYKNKVDVILLTTQVDIEYYTGFKTQFLQSPTRPWYLLLPLEGEIQAIIPTIGLSGMQGTWVKDIQTWSSPNPEDEGISLLTNSIKNLMKRFNTIGLPQGHESTLRMPINDYERLKINLASYEFKDVTHILRYARYIKSPAEIEKIKYICEITSQGFKDLPTLLKLGESERKNCQRFKKHLLDLGVDDSP